MANDEFLDYLPDSPKADEEISKAIIRDIQEMPLEDLKAELAKHANGPIARGGIHGP